jgi:uncharacterized damage-inducible protein DinB
MDHMDCSTLLVLHKYNCYANTLLLQTAAKMDDAAFTAQASPSHGSVQQLLMHILAVEASFLARCTGEKSLLQIFTADALDLDEIIRELNEVALLRRQYLESVSQQELDEVIEITLGGKPLNLTRWQMLAQSLISSIHHRGELSIVMTGLGHPLPTLDPILQFVRESGQEWPFK